MMDVLWNATLYCLVNSSQHFEGLYCFQKFRNTATEHNSLEDLNHQHQPVRLLKLIDNVLYQ